MKKYTEIFKFWRKTATFSPFGAQVSKCCKFSLFASRKVFRESAKKHHLAISLWTSLYPRSRKRFRASTKCIAWIRVSISEHCWNYRWAPFKMADTCHGERFQKQSNLRRPMLIIRAQTNCRTCTRAYVSNLTPKTSFTTLIVLWESYTLFESEKVKILLSSFFFFGTCYAEQFVSAPVFTLAILWWRVQKNHVMIARIALISNV